MPAKKEESYDCKVECAELKKEVAALKKEIAALKKGIKAKPSGGADPRVDKLIQYLSEVSESWKNKLVKIGLL